MKLGALVFSMGLSIASQACCGESSLVELRPLKDFEHFSFNEFDEQLSALVKIVPGKPTGEKKHGRDVVPGKCEVVFCFTGTKPDHPLEYLFEGFERNHILDGPYTYCPFESGGFAICKIQQEIGGMRQFDTTVYLPPGWEDHVKQAWEYYSSHKELYYSPNTPAKREELEKSFTSDNPFLVVMNFRQLYRFGWSDENKLKALLEKPGVRQSIIAYMTLEGLDSFDEQTDELISKRGNSAATNLKSLIKDARSCADLIDVTAAVSLAWYNTIPNSVAAKIVTSMRALITEKEKALNEKSEASAKIDQLLKLMKDDGDTRSIIIEDSKPKKDAAKSDDF